MKRLIGLALTIAILAAPATTFAHSKVTPAETGIAKKEIFTATVANEKDIPTTSVRVELPAGLEHVDVYAKTGWTARTVKDGEETKEIIWTGGQITGELKDTFVFGAEAPATEQTLTWKIYQTYVDNTVVSWINTDKNAEKGEGSNTGPASYTKVVDDLTENAAVQTTDPSSDTSSMLSFVFGLIGAITGVTALLVASKKKTNPATNKKDSV